MKKKVFSVKYINKNEKQNSQKLKEKNKN